VELVLWNEGVHAFQPDVFGSTLVITRTTKTRGSGTFSLFYPKLGTKKVKRELIQEICRHFSIEVWR
jgi:hypothetical protein